jgi:hypothetical protein
MTSWSSPLTLKVMSTGSAKLARAKTCPLRIPDGGVAMATPANTADTAAVISKTDCLFMIIIFIISSCWK